LKEQDKKKIKNTRKEDHEKKHQVQISDSLHYRKKIYQNYNLEHQSLNTQLMVHSIKKIYQAKFRVKKIDNKIQKLIKKTTRTNKIKKQDLLSVSS